MAALFGVVLLGLMVSSSDAMDANSLARAKIKEKLGEKAVQVNAATQKALRSVTSAASSSARAGATTTTSSCATGNLVKGIEPGQACVYPPRGDTTYPRITFEIKANDACAADCGSCPFPLKGLPSGSFTQPCICDKSYLDATRAGNPDHGGEARMEAGNTRTLPFEYIVAGAAHNSPPVVNAFIKTVCNHVVLLCSFDAPRTNEWGHKCMTNDKTNPAYFDRQPGARGAHFDVPTESGAKKDLNAVFSAQVKTEASLLTAEEKAKTTFPLEKAVLRACFKSLAGLNIREIGGTVGRWVTPKSPHYSLYAKLDSKLNEFFNDAKNAAHLTTITACSAGKTTARAAKEACLGAVAGATKMHADFDAFTAHLLDAPFLLGVKAHMEAMCRFYKAPKDKWDGGLASPCPFQWGGEQDFGADHLERGEGGWVGWRFMPNMEKANRDKVDPFATINTQFSFQLPPAQQFPMDRRLSLSQAFLALAGNPFNPEELRRYHEDVDCLAEAAAKAGPPAGGAAGVGADVEHAQTVCKGKNGFGFKDDQMAKVLQEFVKIGGGAKDAAKLKAHYRKAATPFFFMDSGHVFLGRMMDCDCNIDTCQPTNPAEQKCNGGWLRTNAALGGRSIGSPSGHSREWMMMARYLKLKPRELYLLRLALVAWMVPFEDHSFHEIMVGCEDAGLPFVHGSHMYDPEALCPSGLDIPQGDAKCGGFKHLLVDEADRLKRKFPYEKCAGGKKSGSSSSSSSRASSSSRKLAASPRGAIRGGGGDVQARAAKGQGQGEK